MLELLKACSGSKSAVAEAKEIERTSEKDQALMFGSSQRSSRGFIHPRTYGRQVKFTCHHTRKTHTDRHMDGVQGDQLGGFPVQFFQGILLPDNLQLFKDSLSFLGCVRVRT